MRQIDSKIEQVVNLAAFGRHRSRLLFGTWTEHVTLQEREKNQRWSSPAVVMCIILATKRSVFSLRTTKRWLHSKPSTNWELDIVSTSSTWIHVGDSHGFSISIYWYIYIHIYTHIYIYIHIYILLIYTGCWFLHRSDPATPLQTNICIFSIFQWGETIGWMFRHSGESLRTIKVQALLMG